MENTTETPTKKPTLTLWSVRGEGRNARWFAIGAAWPTKDGMGFTLDLDALPIGDRLVLLPPREPKQ